MLLLTDDIPANEFTPADFEVGGVFDLNTIGITYGPEIIIL
jgi:hypothetical protein